MERTKIYLLLGGNEGDRQQWLATGRQSIAENIGAIIAASGIYETAAWGKEDQAPFLNQVVIVESTLSALQVLQQITNIELNIAWRKRAEKWAARTLDIDILFYGDEVIHQEGLTVPHPHLQERKFALVPLCEIAAEFEHPIFHRTCSELLAACPDSLPVKLLAPSYAE